MLRFQENATSNILAEMLLYIEYYEDCYAADQITSSDQWGLWGDDSSGLPTHRIHLIATDCASLVRSARSVLVDQCDVFMIMR